MARWRCPRCEREFARTSHLDIVASHTIAHPRVVRSQRIAADRVWNVLRLHGPDDVDEALRAALTSAYEEATD